MIYGRAVQNYNGNFFLFIHGNEQRNFKNRKLVITNKYIYIFMFSANSNISNNKQYRSVAFLLVVRDLVN